ncbi:MAG TPA: ABC transporter ATP-binding protein [Syntrophorhabdaceae bacterium]|nr:ABC transporter ATP-binding protein [Syntrophorhabdaceae bacterium]HOD76313.1 ABC transporter ATP-binding protein [Syntrophorhabdaceae bacterium]
MMEKNGHILTISGVTKTFDGVRALDDVSFSVRSGDIKALIGPNGAGKTTLLNAVSGLNPPTKGSVLFEGRDVVGLRTDQIASLGMSRTFQLIRLFTINNATVLDNVLLGAHMHLRPTLLETVFLRGRIKRQEREATAKAMDLLKLVGIEKEAHALPGELSFGSQRLLELARALMTGPRMLLLDEPASGLNDAEVEEFTRLLMTIKQQGITILIVEHNMKLVMNIADDIIVLDFGRKLAEGPPSAICANPDVIEAYLGAQSKECGVTQ